MIGPEPRLLRRWLNGGAAVLLLAVAAIHGTGLSAVTTALEGRLSLFLFGALQAVWLAFSVTGIGLGAVFLAAAAKDDAVPRWVLGVLACIPIA
jgi:NO-binding membrane sensor protein with MHYT domain